MPKVGERRGLTGGEEQIKGFAERRKASWTSVLLPKEARFACFSYWQLPLRVGRKPVHTEVQLTRYVLSFGVTRLRRQELCPSMRPGEKHRNL